MFNKLLNLFIPPASQEAFTKEAATYAESLPGGFRVEIAEALALRVYKGEGEPTDVSLQNPYISYINNRTARKRIISQYLDSLLELEVAQETILPKNIIPTIKDKAYIEEIRSQITKKGKIADDFFVAEEYNEELSIVYAVDSPKSIRFLNPADLKEVNLQGESLRSLAIGNLKTILPAIEVLGKPPFFTLKAGNMFESSLLLLDRVWNKAELGINGDIIVAVPARDTVLVADSQDANAMRLIRKAAQELSASAPYRLTPKLFRREGDRFAVLQEA